MAWPFLQELTHLCDGISPTSPILPRRALNPDGHPMNSIHTLPYHLLPFPVTIPSPSPLPGPSPSLKSSRICIRSLELDSMRLKPLW